MDVQIDPTDLITERYSNFSEVNLFTLCINDLLERLTSIIRPGQEFLFTDLI